MAASRTSEPGGPEIHVAIVGGGCAGLSAAWQLSKLPGYRIAVYEQSWRLGGKGASGRDDEGRIREHGLHVWMGFYENAFRMMRECYAEAGQNGWGPASDKGHRLAHGSIDEAFVAEPHIGVAVPHAAGGKRTGEGPDWAVWSGFLPPAEGLPGEPLDRDSNPFTLNNYLLRCFELLKTLMHSVVAAADEPATETLPQGERAALEALVAARPGDAGDGQEHQILAWMVRMLHHSGLTVASVLLQAVNILEMLLRQLACSPVVPQQLLRLIVAVLAQTRKLLDDVVAINPQLRYKTDIINIVITIAVGLYRDRVLFDGDGFDAVNDLDYRDWLRKHGATETAVGSAFITGTYDLVFAYRGGEREQPALAAGVALRGALRMFFTYRGALFWKMQSGMGDAVFAPLYRALQAKGVTFHFLHRLDKMRFEDRHGGDAITELHFRTGGDPTALDAQGEAALDHYGCWPDDLQRFDGGSAESSRVLSAGEDYHAVILAAGKDDFCAVGERSGLFERLGPEWKAMRQHVGTVATQSAQVWMTDDFETLGWQRGPIIGTGFRPPFGTWADMTHTLTTEHEWRAALAADLAAESGNDGSAEAPSRADKSVSVTYFCGELSDRDIVNSTAEPEALVAANLRTVLERGMQPIWPKAFEGKDNTPWKRQSCPPHIQANHRLSDRYTLSLPGSPKHRISPLDDSVSNMAIAGDWTAAGLDAGCVETAVMSGMLAAHAISGAPDLEDIVGYDHP